ncbi:MAG TPA: oligosaccharide flippase family protein [Vicinamibacterales bacterium]|nr:oligosaccharide flippase family protein [Vicinamibacterales bacterium]
MLETLAQRYLPPLVYATVRDWRERFVPKGSLKGRFAGAVFWSLVGMGVSNAAGLATGVALARLMGREGYGEVGVVMGSWALFSQLGGLGLGVTAAKYSAERRGTDPASVGPLLGGLLVLASVSYAISALALVVLAPQLAVVLNRATLVGPLRLSGLVLFLQGVDSIQSGILSGYEAFRAVARVTMLRVLVNLPVTVVGAYLYDLYGVVGAMIVTGVFTLALNRLALNAVLRQEGVTIHYVVDLAMLRPLWEFSLPAFLSATLTMASTWVLNAMLVNQPSGYSQMGLFNAANQWRTLGVFVPTVFNSAVLSIQTSLFAADDRASYHRSVTGNLLVQGGLAALVVLALIGLAPFLMRMYGSQYQDAATVLVLLALGWLLLTPTWILWIAAISRGHVWWGFLFNAIGVTSLFILARSLVSTGARGIALALLYGGLIQVGLQIIHYVVTRRRDEAGQILRA